MEIEQENKLYLKFKIPKIDSSAGASSSSPDNMMMSKAKRVCPECNKEFGTGKALGGHMRVHAQAIKKQQHLHKMTSPRNQPIFKNHRNQSRSYSENSMSDRTVSCSLCCKKFPTMQSLFGHMRCHPDRAWRGIKPPRQVNSSSLSEDEDDDYEGDTVFDCLQLVPKWPVKARRGKRSVKNELSEVSGSYEDLDEDEEEEMRLRNAVNDLMLLKHMDGSDSSGLSTLAAAAEKDIDGVDQHQDQEEVTNGNSHRGEEFDDMRFVGHGFEQVGKERKGSLGKIDDYPVMRKMITEEDGFSTDHVMKDYIGSVGQEGNAVENQDVEDGSDGMNTELVLGSKHFDHGISYKDNHGEMVIGNCRNNKAKKMKMKMEFNQEKPPAVGGSGSVQAAASIASDKYKCSTCNKSFSSHQALGGHRSSHNKFKMIVINGTDSAAANKHPLHQPSSVSACALPDQSLVRTEELNQSNQQQLNRSEECATKRNNIDEVGGSSKADHISSTVHQCSVCYKIFPSGQALGGHKRCHWTAPADGRTEAQAQPQAQLAVRSSGEEASTQAGGKRIRLMGFDLNVPASMVDDAQDGCAVLWQ